MAEAYSYEDWKECREAYKKFELVLAEFTEMATKALEEGITGLEDKDACRELWKELFEFSKILEEQAALAEEAMFKSDPKPLEGVDLTPFPIDCLPSIVGNYVRAVSETTQTAPEMGGVLALGALAITRQGKDRVQVKPDYGEQLSLFTVAIADPGERKSSVVRHFTAPIDAHETEHNKYNNSLLNHLQMLNFLAPSL